MAILEPSRAPVALIVRDGWGQNPIESHASFNAVALARTPIDDALAARWPSTLIQTCGEAVGLPPGTMGNSEVGHQNIGAGRVVSQELMRITGAIRDGSFPAKPVFGEAFDHARRHEGRVHLLGLVSDGQVHSDLEHLFALLDVAAARGIAAERLVVHVITDGRDTAPNGGLRYVQTLEAKLAELGIGRVASVIGRFYAMDRDNRWERVAAAFGCLTGRPIPAGAMAARQCSSATDAIRDYYDHPTGPTQGGDEFIVPTQIVPDGADPAEVQPGDAVIFFNFRGDRPRELTRAFVLDDAAWADVAGGGFDRGARIDDLFFATMSNYERGLPTHVVFERPPKMDGILGEVLADSGLTQFRCAETEKFPHVTFFFNDYREEPFQRERRLLVPSPRDVATYDQKPEMSAAEVTAGVMARLAAPDCEAVLVINFANADMVGHTGSLPATIRAVETVDAATGQIVDAVLARGGAVIVTADHGNAEQMWNPELDIPHTAHTTYDVPLRVIGHGLEARSLRDGGCLGDIAPTMLELLGIQRPDAMTGRSLLEPT